MAYGAFADIYDAFNEDANYDAWRGIFCASCARTASTGGIVADLGCGHGRT